MNVKEAHRHTHSLSNTSKMPGKSYGIQAKFCGIGAKLAKVEGTVCSSCYGLNGFYNMPTTTVGRRHGGEDRKTQRAVVQMV